MSYFCNIIQKLFLKFELKRTHREIGQERPLIINKLFTDNIIVLIKIDFNFKFIDKKKSNLIKHQYDEEKIFNLNDLENTHDEDSLNKICVISMKYMIKLVKMISWKFLKNFIISF